MPDIAQQKVTEEPGEPVPSKAWSGLEGEVIGLFVQLSTIIGLPRSYAEIYGALFMSLRPMTMDELIGGVGYQPGLCLPGPELSQKGWRD